MYSSSCTEGAASENIARHANGVIDIHELENRASLTALERYLVNIILSDLIGLVNYKNLYHCSSSSY